MNKIIEIAVADSHPFKGPSHCETCKALFFAPSNEKWNNLLARWEAVRRRMWQTHQIDPQIASAIMTRADENEH